MAYPIEDSLELAAEYVDRLGDTIESEFEGSSDGSELRGLSCAHGSHTYLVMAAEGWEWIRLRYPLNVDQLYAVRRLAETSSSGDLEISEAQINQARNEFDQRLDDMAETEKREFRMNMVHLLSRESTIVTFDTTSPLNIHGFNLDQKLFIHEDNFALSDFHNGVQQIINLGWVGKEFILDNYGFRRTDPDSGGAPQGVGP